MKHLKLFEEFYFYGKEEEEETCPSCGCEECECTGEEGEENYNEMPDMFGEGEMDEEMPDMGGNESGFTRIKPFSDMGEEEEDYEEEEEDIMIPVERKFEAKKMTKKEKELAAKYPPKDKITRGDIITAAKENADKKKGKKKTNPEELPADLKKAIKAGVRD